MARNPVGTNFFSKKTSTLDICLTNEKAYAILAKCVGAAPSTADLFAIGCLMIRDNGAHYRNTGTVAIPVWTLIGTVGAGSITANELAADSVITSKILNANVTSAKLDPKTIQYAEASITKANILAMNGAPVEIVPTAGAGTAIEFVSATVIFDYATAAYTGGGDVTINYSGGSAVSNTIDKTNSFGAAGDKVYGVVALDAAGGINMLVNTGLSVTNATGAFTDPGTAAGVARIKVAYRVHTTGL